MKAVGDGRLLRIYVCEGDTHDGLPLAEAIMMTLRDAGIAGATVFRGVSGFGDSHVVHTARVLRLCEDLPMVIEAIDTSEHISEVLPAIEAMVGDGLITSQEVEIHPRGAAG